MGIESIRRLFIEQTTPMEVVMFIFVSVAIFMLVVAIIYIALMMLLWGFRLRKKVELRHVFFPTGKQFKENMGEYLLALVTAFIVTLTLAAKHDLVEQIRDFQLKVSDLKEYKIAHLFPLHKIPDDFDFGELISADKLLSPAIEVGRSEPAKLVVKAILESDEFRGNSVANLLKDERFLITGCTILIIMYLLWLASRRFYILKAHPDGQGSIGYARTARSLFVLAVCIALLLAAPSIVSDPEHLAESSLAALRNERSEEEAPGISQAINVQNKSLSFFYISAPTDVDSWQAQLGSMNDRVTSNEECCNRLAAEFKSFDGYFKAKIEEVIQSQNTQDSRISALEDSVQRHSERFNSMLEELRSIREILDDVIGRQQNLDESLLDIDNRFKIFETNFQTATQRMNDWLRQLQQAMSELSRRTKGLEGEISRIIERIRNLEERLSALEERMSNVEKQIRGLSDPFGRTGVQFNQSIQRIETLEKTIRELDKQIRDMNERVTNLGQRLGTLEKRGTTLRERDSRGILIVHTRTYGSRFQIVGPGINRTITTPGVLQLEPGTYRIIYGRRQITEVIESGIVKGVNLDPVTPEIR